MKRVLSLFLLLVIFSIGVVNANPIDNHGKLQVNGTNIVDKNGNKFQLRGVSSHGIAWFPEYVNKDAFIYMRDNWNINTVRLAMYSEPNAGYKPETVKLLKQGVDYAIEEGLYVIIDWHILNDNNPNIHKGEAIKFFKEVASLYKDYDNIIYEICNEPNGGTTWNDIKSYAMDVIKEIRNIDDDAIIVVGTPNWSQDVDVAANNPITGYNNIMYTLHFYAGTHKDWLRNKADVALNKGLPLFITEFGMINADGNGSIDYKEADKWMKYINDKNISFMIWALSNKNEGASLIRSDVKKTSGWSYDELAPHGKWFYDQMKNYSKEEVIQTTTTTTETTTTIVTTTKSKEEVKNNNTSIFSFVITIILVIALIAKIVSFKIKNMK